MKKVILLASALSAVMGWGQTSIGEQNDIQRIIPATPETYSIFKAGDFPVDYRKGKLNVSVPLYEIKTRHGVNIPISLNYNTGGIKVDETSATVGLGWALAIPNSISVEVHGKSDLTNNTKWFPGSPFNYEYTNVSQDMIPSDVRPKIYALLDGVQDMQPDIFHYNLPTISGSFVMDSSGKFHPITYDNIKISYSDVDGKFQITDPKGIIYTLRPANLISSSIGLSTNPSVSSFFVESIKLPSNEVVSFKYEKRMHYYTVSHSYQDIYAPIENFPTSCRPAISDVHSTIENRYIDFLITEITYGGETVKFNYKNTINGVLGRKDINASNIEGSFALDQVIVNNSSGDIVRNYKLNHTYFGSTSSSNYRDYRLKLNGVDNILEHNKYSFEYNESYLPAIESFTQDIWGYYNNRGGGLIPNMRYFNINYATGGDRNVYGDYSQAFILKKIKYPTGGSSSFSYENNTVWDKLTIPERKAIEYGTVENFYNNTQSEYDMVTITTPQDQYFYINNLLGTQEELWVEFNNSCSNQNPNHMPENGSSSGTAYLEELINNHWKIIATFNGQIRTSQLTDQKFFLHPQAPKRIRTERTGNCFVALRFYKIENVKNNNQNNIVGGVRIKSIEDFDGSTNYTKRKFEYHNPYFTDNRSSAYFASPLEFLQTTYKLIKDPISLSNKICEVFVLGANQSINSSLVGRDVVYYEYVTEHTLGKGKKIFKYNVQDNQIDLALPGGCNINPYQLNNNNLLSETSYSLNENTPLREVNYNYTPTYFKNILSADYASSNPEQILSSTVMLGFRRFGGTVQNELITTTVLSNYPIQSGKFLLDEIVTKDYINGSEIITKVNNNYSIDNIQKPINLMKQSVAYGNSNNANSTETSYQYAHEKNNQKLINANMVGIPLETSVLQKKNVNDPGNIISKTETKYDDPATLFPTSVLSYDLQNPNQGSTELSYDKYDSKGNIVQYTNRSGVSTVIIWGYNQTQPIAKIENAKLESIGQPFIDSIVNASNLDAAAERNNDETNLLNAFKDFRNNLSGYQITTYSYDPLIGVRSITPPSGIREIYLYDVAGRLKEVREHNNSGKLLKEFNYHYKN